MNEWECGRGIGEVYSFDLCNYINILHIKNDKDSMRINLKIEYRDKQMNQKYLLNLWRFILLNNIKIFNQSLTSFKK